MQPTFIIRVKNKCTTMLSDTTLYFRWIKIITVGSLALMSFLIFIGNTTNYYANYYFVEHVMKMDTIFPNSEL